MALQIEHWPVAQLAPYAANARLHSPAQIKQIAASIQEFGFNVPCLIDDSGALIAGHGRLLAAKELKITSVPVIRLRHLSETQARAFRLADNQLALNSSWDIAALQEELRFLDEQGFNVEIVGFDDRELAEFAHQNEEELTATEEEDKSALLELVNVTMAEPRHEVEYHDHFTLLNRHEIFCESVISGFQKWGPFVTAEKWFCPYGGVFVPFARLAMQKDIVIVQPDPYIVAHTLDRFEEVHPNSVVKR